MAAYTARARAAAPAQKTLDPGVPVIPSAASGQPEMADLPRFGDGREAALELQPDEPVYCYCPTQLATDVAAFRSLFPGKTAYAVKTNSHPLILNGVARAGFDAFDVASPREFQLARGAAPDSDLFYMHPVKSVSAIRTALTDFGIRHLAIDHEDEAAKIFRVAREAGIDPGSLTLFVRLATKSKAVYDLSRKFGAAPGQAVELLRRVVRQGAQAGLCFHVGSQLLDTDAHEQALKAAQWVRGRAGVPLAALDIGGGYPAQYGHDPRRDTRPAPTLDVLLPEILNAVERTGFSDLPLIAEPGRAIVAHCLSVIVRVLLRKGQRIYINDGIWASLSDAWTGKLTLPVRLVTDTGARASRRKADSVLPFRVMGATCDSVDIMSRPFWLPENVKAGDWIEIGHIGAYSLSLRTDFNGLCPDRFVEVEKAFG